MRPQFEEFLVLLEFDDWEIGWKGLLLISSRLTIFLIDFVMTST